MKRGWTIGLVSGGVLVLTAIAAFLYAPHWHPSDTSYPAQGLDISHHQGVIDWDKVKATGEVDFVFMKATEGGDHVDSRFAINWAEAKRVGIPHGAYHFFTLCRSGKEQAANFVKIVPADRAALPPVVDLEYLGNCSSRPKLENFQQELHDFLSIVEAHSGKPAILYLTREFDEAYAVSAKNDRPLWLRSIIFKPSFGARHWSIWQMSQFRSIDGIEGRVDWNAASLDFARTLPPRITP